MDEGIDVVAGAGDELGRGFLPHFGHGVCYSDWSSSKDVSMNVISRIQELHMELTRSRMRRCWLLVLGVGRQWGNMLPQAVF